MDYATVAVIALDRDTNAPVKGAGVILSVGQEGFTNDDGYAPFLVEQRPLSFSVHHADYYDHFSGEYQVTGNTNIVIHMDEVAEEIVYPFPAEEGALQIYGGNFYTQDNELWSERSFSLFLAYRRFLAGEDIRPDLKQLRTWGVNTIRVFGPLPWKELGGNYTVETFNIARLGEFFTILAEEGLRCSFVPFCYLWGTSAERQAFAQKIFDIAAQFPLVTIEAVNEPHVGDKPDPRDVLTNVDRHSILTAYGYYPNPKQPDYDDLRSLDTITDHTPRDAAWFRKFRELQELESRWNKPVRDDEPAKAIEPGSEGSPAPHPGYNYTGGKTNVDEFVWHFLGNMLWTPGGCLHTEEGKWGCIPIPGSRQYSIVQAVSEQVWKRVDATWQTGRYTGAHLSICPVDGKGLKIDGKDIWTYASLHNDRALAVRCAAHPPQPKPGWVVVERWGPGGSIVILKRG